MAIAVPDTPSTDLQLKSVPVPAFLAELGVKFAFDPDLNARLVMIPPQVSEKVNVIDPVTSLVQADPNWTPRISIAQLNPDATNGPHFYKQAGNKLAPTKQALEVLGKAAGILYTRTNRIARAELDEGEIGYRATLGVRRSDGSVEEISREKVWVADAERAEIQEAVTRSEEWKDGKPMRGSHKFGVEGEPTWVAEVQKRWLKELKDRSAKTESKAVLRAIRAALQIPHTFTPADAAKPFLVIGFNFTPDYNDAETRRALVAAGLNAQAAMYGNQAALPAADPSPAGAGTPDGREESQPVSDVATNPPAASEATGDTTTTTDGAGDGEGGYNPADSNDSDPVITAAREACQMVPPSGQHAEAGRTLQEILALGDPGVKWFELALGKTDLPETFRNALRAFARVHLPFLYEQVSVDDQIEF